VVSLTLTVHGLAETESGDAVTGGCSVTYTIAAKPGTAAYSSAWGDQHWRAPDENVTRHQAAATVIGRRAPGL
jgi:hypothetical protein